MISGTVYRVQLGAFNKKSWAEKKRQAIEAAGFDAYLACVDSTLWRVQAGAFAEKAEAEKLLARLKNAGFSGIVTTLSGKVESGTAPTPAKKSDDRIAQEVVWGQWGNGAERKQRLEAAGYDYATIQAKVNRLMGR